MVDGGKARGKLDQLEIPVVPHDVDNVHDAGSKAKQKQVLVINKADMLQSKTGYVEHVLFESLKPNSGIPQFDRFFYTSALRNSGVIDLRECVIFESASAGSSLSFGSS
jgi:hypothetical protein